MTTLLLKDADVLVTMDAARREIARGGVFIAGGIAPRIIDILEKSPFRERFEAKGRLSGYTEAIPTHVILHPHTALIGAAVALTPEGKAAVS